MDNFIGALITIFVVGMLICYFVFGKSCSEAYETVEKKGLKSIIQPLWEGTEK